MRPLLELLPRMGSGDAATLQVIRFLKCVDRFHRLLVENPVNWPLIQSPFPERFLNTLNGVVMVSGVLGAIKPRDEGTGARLSPQAGAYRRCTQKEGCNREEFHFPTSMAAFRL